MKLRNYIISLLAACVLVSCSKDENVGPQEPDMTPDAFLSLAVNADAKTKAGLGTDSDKSEENNGKPRNFIHRLSVFVYVGDHCYFKDSTLVNPDTDAPIQSIENIPVKAGNALICVVANAKDGQVKALSEKNPTEINTDLGVLTEGLEKEVHKNLTMSSQLFKVTLRVSKTNCIGYTDSELNNKTNWENIQSSPIPLYRNVARVQLSKITLKPDPEYGTATKFVLKKIFMANVKSVSNLIATDGAPWGPTEVTEISDVKNYWYGAFATESVAIAGDSLKQISGGTQRNHLAYDFKTPPYADWNSFLYHDEDFDVTAMDGEITLDANHLSFSKNDGNNPIGNFFYVYENKDERIGYQTLLVICGDYSYKPGEGPEKTLENRYYAIVVNGPDNKDGSFNGVAEHHYIKRNTKYNISATIAGPGSEKPFNPSVRAYIGSNIDVLAWDVVKMSGSVD